MTGNVNWDQVRAQAYAQEIQRLQQDPAARAWVHQQALERLAEHRERQRIARERAEADHHLKLLRGDINAARPAAADPELWTRVREQVLAELEQRAEQAREAERERVRKLSLQIWNDSFRGVHNAVTSDERWREIFEAAGLVRRTDRQVRNPNGSISVEHRYSTPRLTYVSMRDGAVRLRIEPLPGQLPADWAAAADHLRIGLQVQEVVIDFVKGLVEVQVGQ